MLAIVCPVSMGKKAAQLKVSVLQQSATAQENGLVVKHAKCYLVM